MNGVRLDSNPTIPLSYDFAYGSQTSIAHIHAWLEGLSREGAIGDGHQYAEQNSTPCTENIKPWTSPHTLQRPCVDIEKRNRKSQSTTLVDEFTRGSLLLGQSPDARSVGSLISSPSGMNYSPQPLVHVPTTPVLVRKNQPAPRLAASYRNSKNVPREDNEVCFTAPPWRKRISCVPRSTQSQTPISGFKQRLENAYASRCPETPTRSGISYLNIGGEVRVLSPHVTPYRKGKEPKRIRCPSYYDEDILPSPKVKVE